MKNKPLKFVTVNNKSYGKILKGTKIYYEGKKPAALAKDGKINFGKAILETLKIKFDKYQWIITENEDSIKLSYGIYRVRTSQKTLRRMFGEQFARTKDIKTDIINSFFSIIYPGHFTSIVTAAYVPGTIARFLNPTILPRLSSDDKDAINKFLPAFISSESVSAVNLLKANAQIKTLRELADDLRAAIQGSYSESWWQKYIQKNILIIQQGYIKSIEKINVSVGTVKWPDFSLITHDSYLDILEIKKPSTNLIKLDDSRGNYYWDTEISKALIQVENYIENVLGHGSAVRSFILDTYGINLKVVRPRGIILAGDARSFKSQKEKDDFRLLTQGTKNIVFVTYDELLSRLENYIKVLEGYSIESNPSNK